jgi:hypothetical protein
MAGGGLDKDIRVNTLHIQGHGLGTLFVLF